jgi:hypothetical protein
MINTNPIEAKLEWQTPELEIIPTERTENGSETGNDGFGLFTSIS